MKKRTKVIKLKNIIQLKHIMECVECGAEINAKEKYYCKECNTQNDYLIDIYVSSK